MELWGRLIELEIWHLESQSHPEKKRKEKERKEKEEKEEQGERTRDASLETAIPYIDWLVRPGPTSQSVGSTAGRVYNRTSVSHSFGFENMCLTSA